MKEITITITAMLLLTGCTYKGGDVVDEDKNKTIECTDFRDGEKFTFNTDSINNIRVGVGTYTTFDIVDSNGTKRTLSESMESFMKCEEIKI